MSDYNIELNVPCNKIYFILTNVLVKMTQTEQMVWKSFYEDYMILIINN